MSAAADGADRHASLAALHDEITSCRACPRLVEWREEVARVKRAAFRDQEYWGRPIPGFGDPDARVLVLGLAPAANGANRTGRVFTGDRSGDFLFASMHRTGLANQPTSVSADDGLALTGAWVTAAVRCAPPANKPTPAERDTCLPFSVRELALLPDLGVVVCLGGFAWDAALRLRRAAGAPKPAGSRRPAFGHDVLFADGGWLPMLGCYHPSQQNTFTGKLTEPMIDAVFTHAAELVGLA
ncbi:Type-5 uracil-DNA glycosylase [Paraconexibacter sp. AEG42_29]|uniref:Type-5 uracil-DNA glycosylase n=1 Tax=Paraconexibacter sp. AEG42_29 TaxID=2997339 RepID=A0AAU7B2T8_9ACTN